MGYDRAEQIQEGVSRDGLEGNFWEEGLPPRIHSQLECLHGWSVHNLLWQFVPVCDYSNTERMLTTSGSTTLLVNLESMTSKPNASGGSKNCVAWKVEKAVHYFVHADKVTTDSSLIGIRTKKPFCWYWSGTPFHLYENYASMFPCPWKMHDLNTIYLQWTLIPAKVVVKYCR